MNYFRLGDVSLKIGSGATPLGGERVYCASGTALIRSQNVYNDGFHKDGLAFIGEKHADQLSHVEVKAGDVLLNITGDSVARVCQVPSDVPPARVNQHVAIVRPRADVLEARFLYYYLVSPRMQNYMLALAGAGATRNALTKAMIEDFRVPAVPLSIQKAIVSMLGTLDDKIELNRRMNETLEAMARAIFKSWFVDFGPVRAKAEGRQPFGMDAATAALFPDSFQDSPLGKVPTGWRSATLKQCCRRIENGGTPSRGRSEYWNPPRIPWLTSAEVRQGMVVTTENQISEEGFRHSSAKSWPSGTTVVALYGATAGQVCMIARELCANQACCGLVPLENMDFYIYLCATSSIEDLQRQARGSAQQNLSQQIVGDLPVLSPTPNVCNKFHRLVQPLFEKWVNNLTQSKTLASIRDALLPKLISGEIRVKDAEAFVSRVS
jgi:type I restriction enzyme S subunit